MASRPAVNVVSAETGEASGTLSLPDVFLAPIRPDVVNKVHTAIAKNRRQPYAVARLAGMQSSAESWGTGRAVSRIPRVPGGGTHRSGQGAFGNMCRGGRMFAPTRVWRKWHVKVAVNQRRYALVSAIAASALPALVMARGHRVDNVPEVPLVVSTEINAIKKTAKALACLQTVGAGDDVEKVNKSRKQMRAGQGKLRRSRFTPRRGPLVIYEKDDGIVKAFRNIPGVELCSVNHLNLLQMAPGGHVGRFCVWTEDAFAKLDALYGSATQAAELKKGYKLPKAVMTNADVARIINSDEVQSAVRPAKPPSKPLPRKKNPLKNKRAMLELNPASKTVRKQPTYPKKQIDAEAARKFFESLVE
ncbi:60S ribosomal protein L4-A [Porphyridium purpureum]|uniref:60S ribosomal protein L4-A n=1 Tax=Porphyridium purpureum TaxID=35688 RepID=A0A5J4YUI2_PORPP|nr:60S ribosomal protein L4-A [Porphyridium purpureum]|eukprot:POR1852..scf227_4